MKDVILKMDGNRNIYDDNNNLVGTIMAAVEVKEPENNVDVVKLVGLGVTPDDLIKMKASGLI